MKEKAYPKKNCQFQPWEDRSRLNTGISAGIIQACRLARVVVLRVRYSGPLIWLEGEKLQWSFAYSVFFSERIRFLWKETETLVNLLEIRQSNERSVVLWKLMNNSDCLNNELMTNLNSREGRKEICLHFKFELIYEPRNHSKGSFDMSEF